MNSMCQNLSDLERTFRFVLGLVWLSDFGPLFVNEWLNAFVFLIAWISLIESFVGWCPLKALFPPGKKSRR